MHSWFRTQVHIQIASFASNINSNADGMDLGVQTALKSILWKAKQRNYSWFHSESLDNVSARQRGSAVFSID